jgi:hypothetical protein
LGILYFLGLLGIETLFLLNFGLSLTSLSSWAVTLWKKQEGRSSFGTLELADTME